MQEKKGNAYACEKNIHETPVCEKMINSLSPDFANARYVAKLSDKLPSTLTDELQVDHMAWVARLEEYKEGERCKICYQERLYQSALYAAQNGFSTFTTTLLYSCYQNHEDICAAAQYAVEKVNKEIQEVQENAMHGKFLSELSNEQKSTQAHTQETPVKNTISNTLTGAKPISFYYDDFRKGWQEGIDLSKNLGLYRQKWCGCALSRIESLERMVKREYEKMK